MLLLVPPALAAPYAGIAVDMRDGRVYYEHDADRRQHPASLTKMMTLYLTFEALQKGQIKLDQRVRVSRHAARQPPSKLHLKAGQRVSIRHLIRATAIKSANDAAMVLAETVGGSQKRFGQMMTAKARALGMMKSTFKNPHGLTQRGHLSTARDMALLARHLYFDFPQYYNVFGKRSDTAAGRRIRTTNRLLATYRGAEGMKTGYTRAAGYNLVSIAARGNERIVSVVMGGKSTRSRNAQAARLLDLGFRKAPRKVAIVRPRTASVRVARAPLPKPRPGTPATGLSAIAAAIAPAAVASTLASRSPYAPLYAERPPRRVPDGWAVELGRFRHESQAIALVASMAMDETSALPDAEISIHSRNTGGGLRYSVRVAGSMAMKGAGACAAFARLKAPCQRIHPTR
ncbi:MAG: D-alanyl-D-alanine carboxypeptidase family protein [Pseudomonadota bacterium]